MLTSEQQKLKISLFEALSQWREDNATAIGTLHDGAFGGRLIDHMTEAAFNVIFAQMDAAEYYEQVIIPEIDNTTQS